MGFAVFLSAAGARAQTLGQAAQYNLFTFSNASNSASIDVLGTVAIGGNANFYNYTLGSAEPTGSGVEGVIGGNYVNTYGTVNGSLIIGGSATIADPTINGNVSVNGGVTLSAYGNIYGNLKYGTTISNPNTGVSGTTSQGTTTLPVNFASDATYLKGLSQTLTGLTANGIVSDSYSNLNLTGAGALEIFDVTAAQLSSAKVINISTASGATAIVNVTGAGASLLTLPNVSENFSGTSATKTLFNFSDAQSINVTSFATSILAPYAAVNGTGGQFDGNLVANSLSGDIEIHNQLFAGSVPLPTGVPEPTSVAVVLFGGAGILLTAARRRFKTND